LLSCAFKHSTPNQYGVSGRKPAQTRQNKICPICFWSSRPKNNHEPQTDTAKHQRALIPAGGSVHRPFSSESAPNIAAVTHVRVTVRSPLSDTPTVFQKLPKTVENSFTLFNMALERKKRAPLLRLYFSRAPVGKHWTWTGPFARPRPSSTSDEGGSVVPNSRLITAVIWISTTPMGDAGPLGSTQTTTTTTATRCDKDKATERETKRAPRGKLNGRRVEGDGNFGAQ